LHRNLRIALAALVFLLAVPVFAQNNTGIISGRVTDPTGAVIPNAQITVTQTETNVDAVSATNSDGLFLRPELPHLPDLAEGHSECPGQSLPGR
jgi:hypothetical protein